MPIQAYLPIVHIELYLIVGAVLLSLVTYIGQFRKVPGAKPQIANQICKTIWLLSMVMVSFSSGLSDKIPWLQLQQMMALLSPYLWVVFILEISNQEKIVPLAMKYCFIGLIGLLWLAIITNNYHGLFWSEIWLNGETVMVENGWLNWAARILSYSFCTIAIVFSVRWVLMTVGLRRRQALWFSVAGVFSLLGTILEFFPAAQKTAPMPLGFLINGILVAWGFYRWHVYNVQPLAQQAAVRAMIDSLVVVDEYGYVADMNPAAKIEFAGLTVQVGDEFARLIAAWPALNIINDDSSPQTVEVIRDFQGESRWYQLTVTSIQTRGHCLGKAIVFKNITEQKKNHAKLLEQQKTLSILTERERLGRELHDNRAQICHFLDLELQTVHLLLKDGQIEKVNKQVDRLIEIVKDINIDIRESIVGLKKAGVSDYDFENKLRDYLAWYEKNRGIVTELILPSEPIGNLFGDNGKLQVLRIIQEALTNIRKHAKANRAKVQIEKNVREVTVTIEDDGCGFDTDAILENDKRFGLHIMAERAEEAGGRFQIDSKPGKGTKVIVILPGK